MGSIVDRLEVGSTHYVDFHLKFSKTPPNCAIIESRKMSCRTNNAPDRFPCSVSLSFVVVFFHLVFFSSVFFPTILLHRTCHHQRAGQTVSWKPSNRWRGGSEQSRLNLPLNWLINKNWNDISLRAGVSCCRLQKFFCCRRWWNVFRLFFVVVVTFLLLSSSFKLCRVSNHSRMWLICKTHQRPN